MSTCVSEFFIRICFGATLWSFQKWLLAVCLGDTPGGVQKNFDGTSFDQFFLQNKVKYK